MARINIPSAYQIKTFTSSTTDELDDVVNRFIGTMDVEYIRDVKLTTTYIERERCTFYTALITYVQNGVNGWTD
ncbi:hypothetical protein [Secundilactobacillus muriivasis]